MWISQEEQEGSGSYHINYLELFHQEWRDELARTVNVTDCTRRMMVFSCFISANITVMTFCKKNSLKHPWSPWSSPIYCPLRDDTINTHSLCRSFLFSFILRVQKDMSSNYLTSVLNMSAGFKLFQTNRTWAFSRCWGMFWYNCSVSSYGSLESASHSSMFRNSPKSSWSIIQWAERNLSWFIKKRNVNIVL